MIFEWLQHRRVGTSPRIHQDCWPGPWPFFGLSKIWYTLTNESTSRTAANPSQKPWNFQSFWVHPCWWIKRFSLQKKTVSFLPPIVLSELLFHWSMNYTANWVTQGYPTTSYKNQTKNHWWFVRILVRILGVIHGMNVRKVLFVAGHSSHCRLAGERNVGFSKGCDQLMR